jgi:hypothetical protein
MKVYYCARIELDCDFNDITLEESDAENNCDDGIDNDCDGFIDLDDPDCTQPSDMLMHLTFDSDFSDETGNVNPICYGNCPFINNTESAVGLGSLDTQDSALETIQFDLSQPYTISFWLNPQGDMTGYKGILAQDQRISATNSALIWTGFWIYNGMLSFGDHNCMEGSGPDLDLVQLGTWYHVSVTFDGTTKKIYVDGIEEWSDITTSCNPDATFKIGVAYNDPVDALIDDLRIYGRALSQSEVSSLFALKQSFHPADNEPRDGTIQLTELNVYIQLWKTSSDISLAQLIEVVELWKAG